MSASAISNHCHAVLLCVSDPWKRPREGVMLDVAVDLPQRLQFDLRLGQVSVNLVDDQRSDQVHELGIGWDLHEANCVVHIHLVTDHRLGRDAAEWRVEGKFADMQAPVRWIPHAVGSVESVENETYGSWLPDLPPQLKPSWNFLPSLPTTGRVLHQTVMLRRTVLGLLPWLISPNVAQALTPESKELQALNSELEAQRGVLSKVERQNEQTSERLQDKVILQQQLGQQLSSLQKLNQQLSAAEKERVKADKEVKQLSPKGKDQAMLLMDVSLEEELKQAEKARMEQQAAEMSSLSAQVTHFRSEIRHLQKNVAATRHMVQQSEQQNAPLVKAEEKEVKQSAFLQQKLDSRTGASGTLRAKDMAMTQQKKMLMKENQLVQLNEELDNRSVLLEKEKEALEAERLHAEDATREATQLTDVLALKKQKLQTDQRKLRGLGTDPWQSEGWDVEAQSTQSLQREAGALQKVLEKEVGSSRQKLVSLVQQIHAKDEQIDDLKYQVSTHEGEVKDDLSTDSERPYLGLSIEPRDPSTHMEDVMSKIKTFMNRTKELRHKAKAQVLLQERENASAISDQIQALKRKTEETERSLKIKLQQEESTERAKNAETLREYQQQHSTAAAHQMEMMAQAQRHQMEQQHKKYSSTQTRLATEIKEVQSGASKAVHDSSSDLELVNKAISRVRASEAVKVAKVNQQMTVLMKSAAELKKKFLETDSKVDQIMSAESFAAERMKQMKLKVDEQETTYEAAKRRVEQIYEELRAGGKQKAEVKRLKKALQAAKKQQEQAVSLLSEKLKE
eukprot:s1100_g4.t1